MENNTKSTAINKRCSAAFTGHRSFPYGGTAEVKAALTELIRKWHGEGITNYMCGMALGFDLMAAECVLQAKRDFDDITLTAVIPFRDQCGMWNRSDSQRYHAVLLQADFRILLSDEYYKGCLLVRNDFLLKHASRIVACYDGRRRGGTFYTCNRARARLSSCILPVMPGQSPPVLPPAYLFITSRYSPSYIIASRSLALALSRRPRFGFIRCEVRPSRLIRRLEVHFLQNLPPAESIWQEKPSYEADKTAVCCICKTPKRFREKGTEEREK